MPQEGLSELVVGVIGSCRYSAHEADPFEHFEIPVYRTLWERPVELEEIRECHGSSSTCQ
jgi:hypothetical protein